MAGVSLPPGSVDEPLAGLLPAAGGAPHVPVFHPVNLAALFAFSSGLSQGDCPSGRGGQGGVSVLSLLSCAGCVMVCRRHRNACESDWRRLPGNAEAAAIGGELSRSRNSHRGRGLVSVVSVHEVEGGGG